MQSQLLNFKK
jgi:hypothetical protein